jgi:hypothetical protein
MAEVKRFVSKPHGITTTPRVTVVVSKQGNLLHACVFVATLLPFDAHGEGVLDESHLVASPHLGSGVIDPALGVAIERSENLKALHTLLAKALTI